MAEVDSAAELLFFDTFSHEEVTDINLDLVQFPKPVYITQVRIIPLGARVQADFPGGVRLGATNPSKFDLEFFVNDLGMPGASAFENLGILRYNQNDCIHLDCSQEKIPTDGLVLRGWYSTITLAVYGILTNSVTEPIASPTMQCEPAGPEMCNMSGESHNVLLQEETLKDEWSEPMQTDLMAHKANVSDYEHDDLDYGLSRDHYHQHAEDEQRELRRIRRSTHSTDHSPPPLRIHTHSESNDREYMRCSRDKAPRDWSRSPDYLTHRSRRKRSERSRSEVDEHKWPRTPPASIDSPSRPRSPDTIDYDDEDTRSHYKMQSSHAYRHSSESLQREDEERSGTPQEQFEPILSDDEIIGDDDEDDALDVAAEAEYERELEAAALAAPPAIDAFAPWHRRLSVYDGDLQAHYSKELDNLRLIFKKLSMQTRLDNVAAFNEEHGVTVDEREQFVYLGEQLNNQLSYLALHYKRRNFVLGQFLKNDESHLRQAANIVRIALSFQAAYMQPQPAFKIRHIKLGARLAEFLCNNETLFKYLLVEFNFDVFQTAFSLYEEPYMALSIKLQLLKAVYSMLDTEVAVKHFLASKSNGYQMIVEAIKTAKLTRTKYALQAIIKKLHLYEALETVHSSCISLFGNVNQADNQEIKPLAACQKIEYAFQMVMDALSVNQLSYQQPRRFLPVSKKFEVVTDPTAQRSFGNALQSYFVQHSLAESLLILLSNSKQLPPTTFLSTLDLLHALLKSHIGIDYFVDNAFEVAQLLVVILLGLNDLPPEPKPEIKKEDTEASNSEPTKSTEDNDEEMESAEKIESAPASVDVAVQTEIKPTLIGARQISPSVAKFRPVMPRLARLGIRLAYKVQTRYHLDAIVFAATAPEYDAITLSTHMHAIYSQTCDPSGRQHTIEVLGMNNNLKIFMDLIKKEQRLQTQRQLSSPGTKYKSPVLSYAVDMVDACVRYCEQLDYLIEHGPVILELAKNHETFEPSVSAVLQEMYVYMKPLEAINVFAYDDIMPLVEVIGRSLDYLTTFPGDLIMALRILRYLVITKPPPAGGAKLQKRPVTEELKNRFVALQLYAADGVQLLMQILERLCVYFEQPGIHAPALMTIQGVHCCQILLPTLQILRELLSYAILCRDGGFKDLTAIDNLVKVYYLLYYFPSRCQAGAEVEQCKLEVIQTLLAYTQPTEQDEESLHKSLWTQMIREVLKNIDGPAHFIPGLKLLAELLPLPLPMPQPLCDELKQQHKQRLITERKLWSAHLHPQSGQIAKLIEALAPSSFPQLSELLQRVCMQLSDLAPNMTLLIAKTITELMVNEFQSSNCIPTTNLERLLRFSTRLSAFAPLKSSLLSILPGKFWELFQTLLALNEFNEVVSKCQEAVHRILDSFLDSGISLISHKSLAQPPLNLAAALPPKELIPRIIDAAFSNLVSVEVTHGISILAVRNLVILTEHDYTLYHLALLLKQKITEFQAWMERVILHNETVEYNANIESLILLLRSLTQIEPPPAMSAMPPRTIKLGPAELTQLLDFQDIELKKPPILQRIYCVLDKHKAVANEAALCDLKQLIALHNTKIESTVSDESHAGDGEPRPAAVSTTGLLNAEPFLPQAEGIVTQYEARPIFTRFCATSENVQLTARYWLEPLPIEVIEDMDEPLYERIACDLTDLANACLNPDINTGTDSKRSLQLSGSPQSTRELTPTAPCFRTRRVEVEPATGRPEKKMFISAVRGRPFARPPPSRGDLFRSRPPNTSRPPSLHVDDFLALETCGAQPTGPTGYNKIPSMLRGSRVGRNRGSRISAAAAFRQKKLLRIGSPSSWSETGGAPYRSPTVDSHYSGSDTHYSPVSHYSGRPRGRSLRSRPSYLR